MEIPESVVKRTERHESLAASIGAALDRINDKMQRAARLVVGNPAAMQKFVAVLKPIERTTSNLNVSIRKAQAILEQVKSPKPDWIKVEAALDRALEIATRMESDAREHERVLDEILAECA